VLNRRAFLFLVPLLVAVPAVSGPVNGPIMWLATRQGAKVYIFGVGASPDRKWLSPSIKSAVEESKEVWGESPVGPVNISKEYMLKLGTRTQGTLFDDLSAEQSRRVLTVAAKLGVSREQLRTMKPWWAARVLVFASAGKSGTSIENTATPDTVIIDLAKKAGKPVNGEFSSWEEFNRFFDQLSKPAQVQYLFYELDFLEKGGHYKGEDDAWERGDSDYFAEGVKDMMRQYPDLYRAFLIERNANWVRRIGEFLSAGGQYFIVVGVNHTLGPDSIERQLQQHGIAVRAMQTNPDSASSD
jgi:uncharacterized protein